jgi:hypothetical protein
MVLRTARNDQAGWSWLKLSCADAAAKGQLVWRFRATPEASALAAAATGSMFFYVFRGQTSAAAFKSDLAYGGATYAATGRGYKLKVN